MTTNTHIAAQARTRAESLESTSGCTDADQVSIELAADVLRQCAQALEALPALDAQGEAVPMPVNEAQAELMAKLGMTWLEQHAPHRLKSPPPPAVGKPLSEQETPSNFESMPLEAMKPEWRQMMVDANEKVRK